MQYSMVLESISKTLISAATIYATLFAVVVVVKSIYDSAAIESHLNDIEDQLEILHESFIAPYPASLDRWRHRHFYRGHHRRIPHKIVRHRHRLRRMKQKLHSTRRELHQARKNKKTKGYQHTTPLYMVPSEHTPAEIEIEPQLYDYTRAGARVSSKGGQRTAGTTSIPSHKWTPAPTTKNPSVFVFPFGQADTTQNSFSFYSQNAHTNGSTLLR